MAAELGDRSNVHILYVDLNSYVSLKQAAADTAQIVGERGIDYLVGNGAFLSSSTPMTPSAYCRSTYWLLSGLICG